ncbi:ribosomal protein S19 family protein, partial [Aliarcobacter butzleri]|uniref:ribosomal protein S19 family protein n=1 Tax=Aliarcobacter butzleri TaxID=28197 RepID=UPI003AF40E1A
HLMPKAPSANSANDELPTKTWSRRSPVFPEMIGITFNVLNGRNCVPVLITENHGGYKLGECAPPGTLKGHRGSVQRKA